MPGGLPGGMLKLRFDGYISVASSKVLVLNSLIPYLGKLIFRTSDRMATSAKKLEHGSKQIRGF